MNYGFIEPTIEKDHYIFGASPVPDDILEPNGLWDTFLSIDEIQRKNTETWNCTAFGTLNAIEALIYRKFLVRPNYSERFLGIMAGTTPPGNDPHVVCEAIRKYGLIPEEMLPFDDSVLTPEQYYDKNLIKREMLDEGLRWLESYDFKHEWVEPSKMKEALTHSPLSNGVNAWTKNEEGLYIRNGQDNHWTMNYGQRGNWLIDDSYEQNQKELIADYGFTYIKRYYIKRKLVTNPRTYFGFLRNWFPVL